MSNVLLYAATVLLWGSTWLGIEFQLGTVAPEISVVYRYLTAATLLFAWCRFRGLNLAFPWRAHGMFVLLGLSLFGLNYILTYSAQQYISSALNAVAFSTMLWMNIINAKIFLGARFEASVLTGAALGVTGIVVLFWPEVESVNLSDATLYGAALCLSGAFVASLGNMVSQRAQAQHLPVVQSNAWGMLYGTIFTAGVALVRGLPVTFDWSFSYIASLLYLAIFGSIVAFGCYLTLLGRIGAARAGYAVVMFPVVALVLSALFEGLVINWHIVGGVALVLSGNVLILVKRRTSGGTHGRPEDPVSPHPSAIRE